jgi:HPt (histidine-containing phosphotransfer) domain-containing protein
LFVESLPPLVDELQQHLKTGQRQQLKEIAHRIKGTAGNFGFKPIYEAALAMEQRARGDDAFESLQSPLQELVTKIRQIEGYERNKEAA